MSLPSNMTDVASTIAANITSAAMAGMNETLSDTIQANDDQSLSPQTLAMMWIIVIAICFFAKPNIPDERYRRYTAGRNGQKAEKKIDPEERKKIIENALHTKTVGGQRSDGAIELNDTPKEEDCESNSDSSCCEHPDEDDGVTCMICLEPFSDGEQVSWSREMKCRHIFHKECIVPWLMKRDECPTCRATYVSQDDPDTDEETDEGSDQHNNNINNNNARGVFYIINGLVSQVRNVSHTLMQEHLHEIFLLEEQHENYRHDEEIGVQQRPSVTSDNNNSIAIEMDELPQRNLTSLRTGRGYQQICLAEDDSESLDSQTAFSNGSKHQHNYDALSQSEILVDATGLCSSPPLQIV